VVVCSFGAENRNGFYRREQRKRRFNRWTSTSEPGPFTFRVSEGICTIPSFSVLSVSSCRFIFLSRLNGIMRHVRPAGNPNPAPVDPAGSTGPRRRACHPLSSAVRLPCASRRYVTGHSRKLRSRTPCCRSPRLFNDHALVTLHPQGPAAVVGAVEQAGMPMRL
jgi:hypothetical protein